MTDSPRKPVRQDYILRVRYQNTLPPPPFEPKMLKLPMSLSSYTSPSFLSTLIQEQSMRMEMDSELGMPIDLSLIPGIYEGDQSALFAPAESEKLDPKDQALLKSINDGPSTKLTTDSAFLRRTQYISSEIATSSKAKQIEAERAKKIKEALKVELDPAEQLLAVEKTFDIAHQPVSELQHPAKRGLKAVEAWPVMPNFDLFDQQYLNAKFPSNPAPRTKSNNIANDEDVRLEVACMIPRIVDETVDVPDNDYIAYFIPDEEDAEAMKSKNTSADGAGFLSKYRFVREYDAKKDDHAGEWAVTFDDGKAQYLEMGSRMNMRGRRRGAQVTSANEIVELELRDLNDEELAEQTKRMNGFEPGYEPEVLEQHEENSKNHEEDTTTSHVPMQIDEP